MSLPETNSAAHKSKYTKKHRVNRQRMEWRAASLRGDTQITERSGVNIYINVPNAVLK